MDDDEEFRRLCESARSVPMIEVLDLLDLEHPNSSGHIHSIFHAENTPSLHVGSGSRDDNLWYDFSTGKGGDAIAFVREYFGCSFMKAVRFLVSHADPDLDRRTEKREAKVEVIPDLTNHVRDVSMHTTTLDRVEVQNWMADRWPVDPYWAFDSFDLRVVRTNDRLELWAPHYHHTGGISGVKIRTLDGKKLAVPGSKFVDLYTSAPHLPVQTSVAWLVEGESDAWSLAYVVEPAQRVFGLPSGAAMMKPEWVGILSRYDKVMLALDNDPAGNAAMLKWAEKLDNTSFAYIPGGRVAEALSEGWAP